LPGICLLDNYAGGSYVYHMSSLSAKKLWWPYAGFLAVLFHLWLGFSLQRVVSSMLAEKADIFLASLASSTDQTLQASHYLEERIVATLKSIADKIASASPELLTNEWLEQLRQQNDLKAISIYDEQGLVKIAHDSSLVGTSMPVAYDCHDVLDGRKSEHIFGFSEGVFCESDAFGIAMRLNNSDVLRLLTGVDFVLGFEKNVGLTSLIERFRKHPGVVRLDLVDNSGKSLLRESAASAPENGFAASRTFLLHDVPLGRFEVSLRDEALSDLRSTGFLAIFASCFFALFGLRLADNWLQRREERLEEMRQNAETQRRIDGLGCVVAAVAHEVRNPLNTLALALNALRTDLTEGRPSSEIEPRLDLLEQTVMQANQMVKNLLQTSRPIIPQLSDISLADSLAAIAETFQNTFAGSKIALNAARPANFLADRDLLQRLLWNLLLNAQQAGADEIMIYARPDDKGTIIEVSNNGPAIPAEVMANIFVPGNTSRPEGSGMGLYNCQRICAAHNGTIHVSNGNGKTTFVMFFPADPRGKAL
jgi:signal transduction histidine kinase